jgi:hypothetical protein
LWLVIKFILASYAWFSPYYALVNAFGKSFTAGVNFDGSLLYSSGHKHFNCSLISNIAIATVARLSTDLTVHSGAYMMCYNSTYFYDIKTTVEYSLYQDTDSMTWKEANVYNVHNIPGLMGWFDAFDYVVIGRKQMSNWTMLGKVKESLK